MAPTRPSRGLHHFPASLKSHLRAPNPRQTWAFFRGESLGLIEVRNRLRAAPDPHAVFPRRKPRPH